MASVKKYTTAKGDRWQVQFRTPDQRVTRRRGFKTKREAENFAATTHVSKLRGEYIDPADAKITVGELGPDWLERRTHLKPSSRRVEEVAWRIHVEPVWGKARLADIRHSAVQSWVADMGREITNAEGKVTRRAGGPVTVVRAYNVLAGIIDDAVRDRRMLTNPARGVKLPRKIRREHNYLADDQVWDLARQAGPDKGAIVLVLAYCGLRWGELAGLHVADVDLLRRRLHIRRNAVNVGGVVEVGTPKTHERRTVPLPRFLVEPLSSACRGKGRDDIVFPAAGGSYAKSPGAHTWFDGAVTRCTAAADVARTAERKANPDREPLTPVFARVTPHDLRHTAASLAVSAGANVKAVQKMLGHKSAAMTLDTYADLFDRDAEAVADAHDQRLSGLTFTTDAAKMQPNRVGDAGNRLSISS
ncbi:tyrosine-type recombinase/integrase [Mycobacterium sp. CVI_P3]|uniref:Tyrosine-type recombinase/integrase n=1 Tax=Mycobacterium pinniadriaticum TaxID=2994102 RepID=A0ABT3SLU1_9MYCO|nr:tyrosine-type recombinase/integrase [Mycobacterium pinniadriaticum]MCX2934037.1 tyrosine-type recombinase/integrase [Mycobacterium pinniadriaticum]MCX2940466.1 tyrosine-type recombinase/integrase [Mycobacterium pinniadriaticum]